MSTTNARLNRQTFSISRELEYFSEAELTTQTGYGKEDWWPGVIAKELVDNSLDACEQAGTPPRIEVDFQGDSLTVVDNGPGLQSTMLEHSGLRQPDQRQGCLRLADAGRSRERIQNRVGNSLRAGRREGRPG